jgi:hypothetical protein
MLPKTFAECNKTKDGGLACAFGTPWDNHFNGAGCRPCDEWSAETEVPAHRVFKNSKIETVSAVPAKVPASPSSARS